MSNPDLNELLVMVTSLDQKLSRLVTEKEFDTRVPLELREVAEICHVELEWLRARVAHKDIPAYRSGGGTVPWRVYPRDVKAYLTRTTNARKERRQPVLKALRGNQ